MRRAPAGGDSVRRRAARDRRGAVLPLVCILLAVLLAAAALTLDLGRMYLTGAEAQAAADAAALAGARQLQMDPHNAATSVPAAAAAVAGANRVAGAGAAVAANEAVATRYLATGNSATFGVTWPTATGVRAGVQATSPAIIGGASALPAARRAVTRRSTAWIGNLVGANCLSPIAIPYSVVYDKLVRGLTNRPNHSAPEYTQGDMRNIGDRSLTDRSIILAPWPWTPADGKPFDGWWMPMDYTGAGSSGQLTDFAARRNCGAAATRVGDVEQPFRTAPSTYLGAMYSGLANQVCFFDEGYDARCRISATTRNAAPRLRFVLTDDVPAAGATIRQGNVASRNTNAAPATYPAQRIRGVGVLRLICVYKDERDHCDHWSNYTPPEHARIGGYPPGTVLILMTPLAGIDLAPDIVLGDQVSYTQRLVLVR